MRRDEDTRGFRFALRLSARDRLKILSVSRTPHHLSARVQVIVELLAPMGKIALTNYVMQSLFCNILLFGFGFGLYGKISPSEGLVFCILIWLIQMLLSNWYVKRYSLGPLEYLWRKAAYKKIF